MASFTTRVDNERFDVPVKFFNTQTKQPVASDKMLIDTGAFNIINGKYHHAMGLHKSPIIDSWGPELDYSVYKVLIQIGNLKPVEIIASVGPLLDIYIDKPDIGLLGHCNNALSSFIVDLNKDFAVISDIGSEPVKTGTGRKQSFNIVKKPTENLEAIKTGNKPFHPITYINPKNNKSITIDTMIDTGMGATTLANKFAKTLGLDLASGAQSQSLSAQFTDSNPTSTHNLKVKIGNLTPVDSEVRFFDGAPEEAILGPNTMYLFNIRLAKTTITYEEVSKKAQANALYAYYQNMSRYRGRI